ncbi:alpha/beta hydrolase [Thioclava sp.]|uniref:alpha/beta hydrolase n=1 Tax=Thioclava sp. TaxID=1933450 RepID=UPI003AA82FF1
MSLQQSFLNLILRNVTKRRMRAMTDPVRVRAEGERAASWVVIEPKNLCLMHVQYGAVPCLSARVGSVALDAVILYFHGGGYIAGSPHMYRALAGRLSKLSGLDVILPDYRLAPEHPLPAALEDAYAAWEGLISAGYAPERIVIAGDSAGGGLALLLLAKLCAAGAPPAGVIAFSPWTDLNCSGESFNANAATEAILPRERVKQSSYFARGERAGDDPAVSPLFAEFPAAPPVLIQHSMAEILCDDSLRMAERLRGFGGEVTVQSWPNAPHVWQFFDGRLPEAREALEDAGKAARNMLNPPSL